MDPVLDFNGHDVNADELVTHGTVIDFTEGRDYFFVNLGDDPRWVICFLDRARRPARLASDSDEIVFTDVNEQAAVPPRGTRVVCRIFPHGHGRFKASAWALQSELDNAPIIEGNDVADAEDTTQIANAA